MVSLGLGLAIGFVNSIPIGPVNIALVETTLQRGVRKAMAIAIGALTIDALYCIVGVFGLTYVVETFRGWIAPVGIIVILVSGIRLLIRKISINSESRIPVTGLFFFGLFLYLSNYLAISFWILISGILLERHWVISVNDKTLFIIGMVIGTFSWFWALVKAIERRKHKLSEQTINRLTEICGILLIGFSFYLAYGWLELG